jgi:hypothetical protein
MVKFKRNIGKLSGRQAPSWLLSVSARYPSPHRVSTHLIVHYVQVLFPGAVFADSFQSDSFHGEGGIFTFAMLLGCAAWYRNMVLPLMERRSAQV